MMHKAHAMGNGCIHHCMHALFTRTDNFILDYKLTALGDPSKSGK